MLANIPADVPLSHGIFVQQMKNLSLQQLQNANYSHLIQEHQAQVSTPPPPQSNFRTPIANATQLRLTPIQEGDTPGESSAGPSKGKKSRKRKT